MIIRLNRKEEGFTLIELMIVIAIIGILAAIAIPQFSAYRQRAYNSAAQSDLKNLATAQEAYYVDNQSYTTPATLEGTTYGYSQSENVTYAGAGATTTYSMSTFHTSGNKTYTLAGPGGTISD